MNMNRRFICFILSICMIISFLSGFAGAEEPAAFTYTAGDGTVSSHAHLAEAFAALHADSTATASNPGRILQNSDYVITSSTPKMTDFAILAEVQKPFVWDLGDIGVALMTVFNMICILPMGGKAVKALDEYMDMRKAEKKK